MSNPFIDIKDCWYPDLALEAVEEGIVGGAPTKDGLALLPKKPCTREEVWLMFLRMLKIQRGKQYLQRLLKQVLYPGHVRIWSKGANNSSVGTGFFYDYGKILTCAHVVEVDTDGIVTLDTHFQKGLKGNVTRMDTTLDLALVELPHPQNCKPIPMADEAKHGEYCVVFGHPGGEFESITDGIVSHPDRGSFIETDARINPGNSGGIVINAEGKFIGMPSHKIVFNQAWDNQNYCIRTSVIKKFLEGKPVSLEIPEDNS